MKIVAIRGKNLASLAGEFAVEFEQEPLKQAGLFAITGPTGAGKSTLLDALCVALFDKTPRLHSRGGVLIGQAGEQQEARIAANDVRALLRRGAGSGYAEVEFVGRDGHLYRTRWSVRRARCRADGRFQPQTIECEDLHLGQTITGTKSETLTAIEDRVGLSFEQFRRSALLAQGEFAAFLRADCAARAELLERVTGTSIYGAVSRAAYRRALAETRALADLMEMVDSFAILETKERQQMELQYAEAKQAAHIAQLRLQQAERSLDWYRQRQSSVQQLADAESCLQRAQKQFHSLHDTCEKLQTIASALAHKTVVNNLERCALEVAQQQKIFGMAQEEAQQESCVKSELEGQIDEAEAAVAFLRDSLWQTFEQQQQSYLDKIAKREQWLAAHQEWQPVAAQWGRWQSIFAQVIQLRSLQQQIRHRCASMDRVLRHNCESVQRCETVQASAGEAFELAQGECAKSTRTK